MHQFFSVYAEKIFFEKDLDHRSCHAFSNHGVSDNRNRIAYPAQFRSPAKPRTVFDKTRRRAMPDAMSFDSYDAGALADASASSLAELDDKTSRQS